MAAWLYKMLYQVSSRMALPGSMRMAQCCGSQRCKMGAMQNPTGSSPSAPPRSRSTVFCRTASTLWLVGKHGNAPVHEEHPFLYNTFCGSPGYHSKPNFSHSQHRLYVLPVKASRNAQPFSAHLPREFLREVTMVTMKPACNVRTWNVYVGSWLDHVGMSENGIYTKNIPIYCSGKRMMKNGILYDTVWWDECFCVRYLKPMWLHWICMDIGRALEIQMTALNCVPERPLVDARDLRYPYLMVKSPLNHQYFATL